MSEATTSNRTIARAACAGHHPPTSGVTLKDVRDWDAADPLTAHRADYILPERGIYLDGNSLGPLPRATQTRLAQVVAGEWGRDLIGSWEKGWMGLPARVGAKLAPLLGAAPDEVIAADSTSVNLFKLCAAAVALRPGRSTLLTGEADFPTDRHVADGLARLLPGLRVRAVPADRLLSSLDADTAVLLLCHVHYRSGARYDMPAINRAARAAGALVVWDLSHSAGAVGLSLGADGAELAVGCGYKFLNGGPGAPAFLYVAQHLQSEARSPLQGWIGHAAPFGFSDIYEPAPGMARFLAGTPSVLGLAALESGIDTFMQADPALLWAKSARLFDLFADLVPNLELITPRALYVRGSHIAFRSDRAETIMRALAAQGIVGDFRPPDVLRFGLTPSYTSYEDIWRAARVLSVES